MPAQSGYEVYNEHSRVVFLHGYPGKSSDFEQIAKPLDYLCDLYDMPWLDPVVGNLSLDMIVTAIAEEIKDDCVHVVGHDLGAVVGYYLGHKYPQFVKSLTMIATPPLDVYQDNLLVLKAGGYFDYMRTLANHDPQLPLPNLEQFALWEQTDPKIKTYLSNNRRLTNPFAILSLYNSMWQGIPAVSREKMAFPMLLIHGEDDPYFPKKLLIPIIDDENVNCGYHSIAKAGHWVHLTHPNECCVALQDFFKDTYD